MKEDFWDEVFALGFGKPEYVKFNCDRTLDLSPTTWTKTDNGFKATCRTVGINPDDVKVKLEDCYIDISGESEYEGSKYNVSYMIPISDDVISNIKSIKYKTVNGLTHIYLDVERPSKKDIKILKV